MCVSLTSARGGRGGGDPVVGGVNGAGGADGGRDPPLGAARPPPGRAGGVGAERAGRSAREHTCVLAGPAGDDGLRSRASAQPNTVSGRPRSLNNRSTRQNPTRLPYSNMPSAARSRPFTSLIPPDSVSVASENPSSWTLYSEPSS